MTIEHSQNAINHRYDLEQELGRGSMGTVFKAYDRLTASYVALKLVLVDTDRLIYGCQLDLPIVQALSIA